MNIEGVFDSFWSPRFWLPSPLTWDNVQPKTSNDYTNFSHLLLTLPMAVVIFIVRCVLENYCFKPIGIYSGLKDKKVKKITVNPILESAYTSVKNDKDSRHLDVLGLAKSLDWTERQVERWLRVRRSADKQSTLQRFCEAFWRCFYYTSATTCGVVVHWSKPWLWDLDQCYIGVPHQGITNDIWWYNMITLAFYESLAVSQFFDVRRKDFWQMFVHHIITIVLITLSWICNLHRMGSLVILVHDCSDVFVEVVKMLHYTKHHVASTFFFFVFTGVWLLSRCYIYPFWILESSWVRGPKIVTMFPAAHLINYLLSALMVLHVIWTYMVLRVFYLGVFRGEKRDVRSSSEEVEVEGTSCDLLINGVKQ